MKQGQEIKSFIYSHYLSDGFRMTLGVILPALILAQFDNLTIGISASLGAYCVSIADTPGPVTHKRNGMLYCSLFVFLTALITGLINQWPLLLIIEIFILCFFFSMFQVFGNRASSIGIAALLIMVLTIDQTWDKISLWEYAGSILGGGLWYMLLSLSITQIRPYRLAQQELGESIKEVASYLRIKGAFYEVGTDFDKNYRRLIDQQIIVHNHQDIVRELLFKSTTIVKESTKIGRLLVLVFIDMMDLFEQTMATQSDYKTIEKTFGKTQAFNALYKLILKIADELENLSLYITSNTLPKKLHNLNADLEAAKSSIDEAEQQLGISTIVLKKVLINIRNIVNRIDKIYGYFNTDRETEITRSQVDHSRFVSHQGVDLKLLWNNLNFQSSIFRYAIRLSIVCLIGYLISKALPLGHYSYWILLTILVILKPGFSLTKERNLQRLIGTLIGGVAGAGIVYFVKDPTTLFMLLLVFMIASFSFQRINYIISVLFMTPYILILFSLLGEGGMNVAQERIVDTVLGCTIAFVASYFVFPSWEYLQLKNYKHEVLIANYQYLLIAANRMMAKPVDQTSYKLARKEVYVSSANLGSAFQRMLAEPKSKQKDAKNLHKFVVLNHSLSSYIATVISALQATENKLISGEDLKLVRKSLFLLAENIKKMDGDAPFTESDIIVPENPGEVIVNHDSKLLTEQLQFIYKLTSDMQKLSGHPGAMALREPQGDIASGTL
ncbi:MAG TPA: FUSC family membrane protein [Sphingobacteriaceae bacterium]|nr:FUSC family membrane protein [Sphingobacteriaceae bacterium]